MHEIIAIIFSGLCAFLYFDLPKAKIFMGDTGSLALGALFVSLMIIMKTEIYLFIFGLVYIFETLSVMIQVYYFKKTKGKRIFKMAPLHHHFEIVLKSERKTLILFYFFTILTVIIGILIKLLI
jgi:phospho-N-acetylmuramoyl-pentapeptide-transferase